LTKKTQKKRTQNDPKMNQNETKRTKFQPKPPPQKTKPLAAQKRYRQTTVPPTAFILEKIQWPQGRNCDSLPCSRKGKKMNRKIFCLIIAIIVVFAICGIRIFMRSEVVSIDGGFRQVMGTFAHIIAVADNKAVANTSIEAAFERLRYVDETMSDYNPESELSQVNRDALAKSVEINDHLFEVLSAAVEYSKKSGGAFDVTIGPVVDLWRRAGENKQKPTEEALAEAKSKVGYEKLVLDGENKTVKFAVEGMRLDLGAIAKGYAIDMAVEAMKKSGAIGGMVDVGGDIRCFGKPKAGNKCWLIGLQDPAAQGNLLLKLEMLDTAMATSGDYQRFVLIEGQKFSHIFDPALSTSAEKLSSVTIIAPTAMQADILATTVSVIGKEKGLKLIESTPDAEAIIIPADSEKNIIKTSGAEYYIHVE
jgi:thiamine biosynthesis lipoprotein